MQKVEIDLNKPQQINDATTFIIKHRCPAIVVPPEMVTSAIIARGLARANHKIITTIDPRGTQFLSDKFRGMPSESLSADGFEITLAARGKGDIAREIIFLSQFFRDHFNPLIELRFVLGFFSSDRTNEQIAVMCEGMLRIPTPTLVRTTNLTKLPVTLGTPESHNKCIDIISALKKVPIKISGNVNLAVRCGCAAAKFACTLEQAQQLYLELSNKGTEAVQSIVKDEVGAVSSSK